MKEFQLRRIVKIDEGDPIPILTYPRKMKRAIEEQAQAPAGFRALEVTGGKIALENNVTKNYVAARLRD